MLSNARIAVRTIERLYKIDSEYYAMNEVLKVLNREKLKQTESKFDKHCSITTKIKVNNEKNVISQLETIRSVKVSAMDDIMI